MVEREIIIVGGGPAGAAAAWKLKQAGRDVLILEKAQFPRVKLCAGWITPRVWHYLHAKPQDYPHSLIRLKRLHYFIGNRHIPLPTRQYSIRRYEFDHWLLQRSGADFQQHHVQHIRQDTDGRFVIDDTYRCTYLIGAGGTNCPVYRTFFENENVRDPFKRITAMELEYQTEYHDSRCLLWFFDHDLSGYSWYVPKGNGYVNIGIGGRFGDLRVKNQTIRQHWEWFAEKLEGLGLLRNVPRKVPGYNYYLHDDTHIVQKDRVFLVGDAAGVGTLDMGEGIGPAIQSGLLAARSILNGTPYTINMVHKYSLFDLLFWWRFGLKK